MAEGNPVNNEDRYTIRHGKALLMDNRTYPEGSGLSDREGAEHDLHNIKEFCDASGLVAERAINLTAAQMRERIISVSQQGFQEFDSFSCFISSYGDGDNIYGTDGEIITVGEIVAHFQDVDSLKGKPKIFFIQNCHATETVLRDDGGASGEVRPPCRIHFPMGYDMLVACGSVDGNERDRDPSGGSYAATRLAEALRNHAADMSLTELLTELFRRGCMETNGKQVMCSASTLTKPVYFTRREL